MSDTPLHYQSALEIADKIQHGELSSVEVTEHMLKRIADLDPKLKSYVTVTADEAMAQAKTADAEVKQGNIRSRLHGVPIAVKDLLDSAGIKTTYGMSIYKDQVPSTDATVLAKLKEAGTVVLGKLKLTEGAYARHHPDVEPPVNPWNPECWTGVSSSGSGVATAAGLCFAAIGSDTGGSIRFPCASNGLAGLKPTWGRVSRAGVFPLAYTLDHMGPMSRCVEDTAAMLEIIAGRDEADPSSSHFPVPDYLDSIDGSIKGLRIGMDHSFNTKGVDHEVIVAVNEAMELLEDAGCDVRDIHIPYEQMAEGWPVTCAVEAAHAHSATWPSRASEYGSIGQLIEMGHSVTAAQYLDMELARRNFKAAMNGIFQEVDLILCPSMTVASLPREGSPETDQAEQDLGMMLKFTAPFDFSGSPTLCIPWHRGKSGVPLSIQLVAPDFDEELLVTAGYSLEQTGMYFDTHPEI